MLSTNKFYENGLGDRFVDPLYQPEAVRQFLQEEVNVLNTYCPSIDLLVEVGCMHGLHLDWAIVHKKRYFGVDLVKRYVEMGRQNVLKKGLAEEQYRFVVGNAERIAQLLHQQQIFQETNRSLIFFPFNSFGNMRHIERVIKSLQKSDMPFLISSYLTTEEATANRYEYYARCGYKNIVVSKDEKGICISSSDGLCSIAYYPAYLIDLFKSTKISIGTIEVSPSNVFYIRLD